MDKKASEYRNFVPVQEPTGFTAVPPGQGRLLPTPEDIEGPFYKPGSPLSHTDHTLKLSGYPHLQVEGRVVDRNGDAVVGAVLDWWQADENGVYDNTGFTLRGKVKVSNGAKSQAGRYVVDTVRPGYYDISDLADPEPHEFRCAHVHVKVTAPGFKPITTQLYFPDSKYNDTDRWFDSRRCVTEVGQYRVTFDFVLEAA